MVKNKQQDFFQKVYQVVYQIPHGRVSTYGAVARYLGTARSARMVGWAMNSSHTQQPPVPAHRVVNRKGILTGKHHFSPPSLMQQLLENESVIVVDDQVQQFDQVFWDPNKALPPFLE